MQLKVLVLNDFLQPLLLLLLEFVVYNHQVASFQFILDEAEHPRVVVLGQLFIQFCRTKRYERVTGGTYFSYFAFSAEPSACSLALGALCRPVCKTYTS